MKAKEFAPDVPPAGMPKKVMSRPAKKPKRSVDEFTKEFMENYACGPRDLVHQECENWAQEFVNEFGGTLWVTPEHEEPWGKFYHYFVQFNGKFYDGITTAGVDKWYQLPVLAHYLK